jgi:lipoprotein-anchoring transpeptidase ErfK/SrfK
MKNTYGILLATTLCAGVIFNAAAESIEVAESSSISSRGHRQNNVFIFNPRTHSWTAIGANGKIVGSGSASGGRNYCPDVGRSCRTPTGKFYVISKGGPGCKSTRYPIGRGGARMPYCMFFSKLYAVHGSSDVPNYNASHGCIRVRPQDAKWLSEHFIHVGTKIIVKPY